MPSPNAPAYTNVHRLNDELLIAQRADQLKSTRYLHKLGTEWIRRSLRTTDLKTARARAYEAFRVWQDDPMADWLAATGSTKHLMSFKFVAEEWLSTQSADVAYKVAVVRKFLLPFFHGLRPVSDICTINDALIAEYKVWRLNFWQNEGGEGAEAKSTQASKKQAAHYGTPRATTLNRENPTLRQILKYAGKKGYFGTRPVPELPSEASKPNPRPAFFGGDFDKLSRRAEAWIVEADTDLIRMRRQLLADWIWTGRQTGIRLPHEGDAIMWGDVRLDTKLLHIPEETKTGKRDVPLNDLAADRLAEMRARRVAHARKLKQKFSEAEAVFLLDNGTSAGDLGKLFNQLIQRCGFPARSDGVAYSPYSLRHTFATFALAEGKTGDHVAEMMGTSVKMLHNHYKHGTIEQTRRYLAGRGVPLSSPRELTQEQMRILRFERPADLSMRIGHSIKLVLTSDGTKVVIAPH